MSVDDLLANLRASVSFDISDAIEPYDRLDDTVSAERFHDRPSCASGWGESSAFPPISIGALLVDEGGNVVAMEPDAAPHRDAEEHAVGSESSHGLW